MGSSGTDVDTVRFLCVALSATFAGLLLLDLIWSGLERMFGGGD